LSATLAELDAWLAAHRRDLLATLQPSATDEALTRLLRRLRDAGYPTSAPLPAEMETLLRWHDGDLPGDEFFGTFSSGRLLSAEEIPGWFETMMKNAEDQDAPSYFFGGWIPFLENGYSVTCVDGVGSFGAPPGSVVHVDFKGGESRPFLAPNLTGFFEVFVEMLQTPAGTRGYTDDWEEEEPGDHDEARQKATDLGEAIAKRRHPPYPIEHTVDDVADPSATPRDEGPLLFLKLEKRVGCQLWRWECDVDGRQCTERLIEIGKSGASTSHACRNGQEATAKAAELERAKLAEGFARLDRAG